MHLSLLIEELGLKQPQEYAREAEKAGGSAIMLFLDDCRRINTWGHSENGPAVASSPVEAKSMREGVMVQRKKPAAVQSVRPRAGNTPKDVEIISISEAARGDGVDAVKGKAPPRRKQNRGRADYLEMQYPEMANPERPIIFSTAVKHVAPAEEPAYHPTTWVEKVGTTTAVPQVAGEIAAPQQDVLLAEKWLLRQLIKHGEAMNVENRQEVLARVREDQCLHHLETELTRRKHHAHAKHHHAWTLRGKAEQLQHMHESGNAAAAGGGKDKQHDGHESMIAWLLDEAKTLEHEAAQLLHLH